MKSKFFEYGGKLFVVCAVAMAGVAGAWVLARPRIEAGKAAEVKEAIRAVLGLAPTAKDPQVLNEDAPEEDRVFFAKVEGQKRYATEGSHQGFSSKVVVAVGARLEGDELVIREVRVVSQNETPGLGTRVAQQKTNLTLWSKIGNTLGAKTKEVTEYAFLKEFRGKRIGNLSVTGSKAEEDQKILKITGATISSTATVVATREAMEKMRTILSKR